MWVYIFFMIRLSLSILWRLASCIHPNFDNARASSLSGSSSIGLSLTLTTLMWKKNYIRVFFRVSEPQHLLKFNNDISKWITGWMIMATSLNIFFKSVFFRTDKNLVGNTFKCNWWYWCEPYLLSLSYQPYKILIYQNYLYYLINLAV